MSRMVKKFVDDEIKRLSLDGQAAHFFRMGAYRTAAYYKIETPCYTYEQLFEQNAPVGEISQ